MKNGYSALIFGLFWTWTALGAEPASPGEVLENVASRYEKLRAYEINAEEQIAITRAGEISVVEAKVLLAVGTHGMFRVERSSGDTIEIRVSDGNATWKALPKQKLWSKSGAAQIVDLANDDTDPDQPAAQDLFTEMQRSFVTRYTGLRRYAHAAVIEKIDKVKFNGQKVECYVVRISTNGSTNHLYIAKDSFLVLRHSEAQIKNGTQVQIISDYKKISEGLPSSKLFDYQPTNGGREVADVSLPSERNLSWVGRQATDFTLKTIDGSLVHLADLKGKIILLDFWAPGVHPAAMNCL